MMKDIRHNIYDIETYFAILGATASSATKSSVLVGSGVMVPLIKLVIN